MLGSDIFNATVVSFILSVILGIIFVPFLRRLKFGQHIREEGPKRHYKKSGTPTVGGIIILISLVIVSTYFASRYTYIIPTLLFIAGCGLIGFIDDFIKVGLKRSLGLTAIQKMLLLIFVAVIFTLYMYNFTPVGSKILVPFISGYQLDLGALYIPFTVLVIISTVNSVNLTDGLDGLASGITAIISLFFTVAAIMLDSPGMAIVSAALTGSCLGFLIFNVYPARVFMGDTGSLALGAALSALAIVLKLPLFLLIVGGVFVIEALSDIIQVICFKLTGTRFFKMAPLHHHFELKGWRETKVVAIFWIVTGILNIIGLLALL